MWMKQASLKAVLGSVFEVGSASGLGFFTVISARVCPDLAAHAEGGASTAAPARTRATAATHERSFMIAA
jgi:hypothetical protein